MDENQEILNYNSALMSMFHRRYNAPAVKTAVMSVKLDNIWGIYLDSFPTPELRKEHDCHICRAFLEAYGGLVYMDEHLQASSAFWSVDHAPALYRPFVKQVLKAIDLACKDTSKLKLAEIREAHKRDAYLKDNRRVLGTYQTIEPDFAHLSLSYDVSLPIFSAFPKSAKKLPDITNRLLQSVRIDKLRTFYKELSESFIKTGNEYRRFVAPFKEVLDFLERLLNYRDADEKKRFLLWSSARNPLLPVLVQNLLTGVVGQFISDRNAGIPYAVAMPVMREKIVLGTYMRKTGDLAEQQITQAEKAFEEQGYTSSLRRRFAYLEEIPKLWEEPKVDVEKAKRLFESIREKQTPVPTINDAGDRWVSLRYFVEQVLPKAKTVKAVLSQEPTRYFAFTNSVDPDSICPFKPGTGFEGTNIGLISLIKGSLPQHWGWRMGQAIKVTGVASVHIGKQAPFDAWTALGFLFEGAPVAFRCPVDLFPEQLNNALYEHRGVIEKYRHTNFLEGNDKASACGFIFDPGMFAMDISKQVPVFVVTTEVTTTRYHISAWE